MRSKWKVVAAVSALVVLVGVVVGTAVTSMRKPTPIAKVKLSKPAKKKPKPKPPEPLMAVCPFDGLPADQQVQRPVAIMVENLSTIRPQAGLASACVVVEGLAEGGITRFMLLYGAHGSDNIGPVRSARTHFVAMAKGWDALYSHVGGSIYAMRAIKDWNVFDWDQINRPEPYERVSWTAAPHNVFTSTTKIRTAAAKQMTESDMVGRGLKFKPAPAFEARPDGVKQIIIDFSDPGYRVEYQYDRQTNSYKRLNGGQPHLDANTKQQLTPTNIVIMYAPTSAIPGGSGVLDINVTGSGQLLVARDGQVIRGTWEKPSVEVSPALKDETGNLILLSPGQTWFEIVKPTTPVTIQ